MDLTFKGGGGLKFYMVSDLNFTTDQREIYTLLYRKASFDTFYVKYTLDQLVLDADSRLNLTKKKVKYIIDGLIEESYIELVDKGNRGKPTTYLINKMSNLVETQKEHKRNTNETQTKHKNEAITSFGEGGGNTNETQKEHKRNTKVTPIKDKDKDKDKIEHIWALYPRKKGKAKAIKKIPIILKEIGEEKLIECINNYKEEITKENKEERFILQGDTFFNGRYEDYMEKVETKGNIQEVDYDKRCYGF